MLTLQCLLKIKNKLKLVVLQIKSRKNSQYFVGVFNKTIPLALVGYELIIANSALRASLAIYHLISRVRTHLKGP